VDGGASEKEGIRPASVSGPARGSVPSDPIRGQEVSGRARDLDRQADDAVGDLGEVAER